MQEKILSEFTMSAGPNGCWERNKAPKAQVVETYRDGETIYIARSPWAEIVCESEYDAENNAKRLARG